MASLDVAVPCVELPPVPKIPSVTLIGGAELQAFLDLSAGIPDACSVTFNLMGQLAPALAGLTPILKILTVLKALADFASNPLVKGPDLIAAIGELAPLFLALTPAGIAVTVRGILGVIVDFLACFVERLESVVSFQADLGSIQAQIDASPELVSPVLTASLSCANANAQVAIDQTMASLGPIEPLLGIVTSIAGIAGLSLALPSLSGGGAGGAEELVEALKSAVDSLEGVIDSLPG
jgi:hypothetical protein